MASASPTADRIAREHRDCSGETFEPFDGGADTPADAPNGRATRRPRGRSRDVHYRSAGGHGHGP